MEESCERGFDACGPTNIGKADPAREQDLGHRLNVLRPSAMEGSARGLRGRRSMLSETVEVTQQQRLVARVLPDDADVELIGEMLRLLPALIVVLHLVEVEQHHPARELRAAAAATVDLLARAPQPRQRIAGTRTQIDHLEMDRMPGSLQQIV